MLSPGLSPPHLMVTDKSTSRANRTTGGRIHPAANAAGILQPIPKTEEHASLIQQYKEKLRLEGKPQTTITPRTRILKQINKICDITNPYEVTEILAKIQWKNSTKTNFIMTYTSFLKYINKTWNPPHYKKEDKLPFIPTEQEIDQLIASTGKTTATLLQTLKETGARIGEALKLKWLDVNLQQKTANITPEKNSNARILPISDKLINMLNNLPKRQDTLVFSPDIDAKRTSYDKQRNETAKLLSNPKIKAITFHTFRHWKGTMEYHKTKDVMHVKYILGHKNIECTMIYINLEQALYLTESEDFICKVAKTIEEAIPLIEAGFTQATEYNGIKIFKKRK